MKVDKVWAAPMHKVRTPEVDKLIHFFEEKEAELVLSGRLSSRPLRSKRSNQIVRGTIVSLPWGGEEK